MQWVHSKGTFWGSISRIYSDGGEIYELETAIVAVIFTLQILLAVWMWTFYNNAKRDLNARNADAPVLTEVHALQRTVKELLAGIEEASQDVTARMEVRCAEARFLLGSLEDRLSQIEVIEAVLDEGQSQKTMAGDMADLLLYEPKRAEMQAIASTAPSPFAVVGETIEKKEEDREAIYQRAYALAEIGESLADIARETGLSEGELELMLRLRGRTS